MNERIVSVRLPFKVDFVRKRQRTPDFANFLDDNVVLIREVDPEEAPVVYRIRISWKRTMLHSRCYALPSRCK